MRPSLNMVLFNAGGLGVLLFLGVYMVNSFFHKEEIAVCQARYGNGVRFSLTGNNGHKFTSLELQARLSSREWGLLNNARVVETPDGKAQFLQVALGAEGQDDDEQEAAGHDGVGFLWNLTDLKNAHAACLSYRLFLPKDFSFDVPGNLPGLYATREAEDVDAQALEAGFVSRLAWQKDGDIGMTFQNAGNPQSWIGSAGKQVWPVGRWVDVTQEVVLNTPGKPNGLMRVWIDGHLQIEKIGLNLIGKEPIGLSGVVADLGYAQANGPSGRLTISPFVVQRQ
ncbi:MAG: hypothetical protein R3D51_05800 [Hyphomicrobiaceae bacterium]